MKKHSRADLNRRDFLKICVAGLPVGFLIGSIPAGCGREKRNRLFLTDDQFNLIEAVMDRLIPGGETPGAKEAGAADYLDRLLGAFNVDPPLIFGGGPYSGRMGGEASFGNFIPLTRVEEIAWRTSIEGSQGIPEREFNGPVKGLQEIYREGIDLINNLALENYNKDFTELSDGEKDAVIDILKETDSEFYNIILNHTYEGTYSAPEYGGNKELAGWKTIGYPGDVQPIGYTQKEMEELDDPNAPPDLTQEMVNEFLLEFIKSGMGSYKFEPLQFLKKREK